jgi:ribosomal protein S18 acetylase RimI-like enzyme
MLGLLLLDQAHQGRGLGRATYLALENFLRSWAGIHTIRIGVVMTNEAVLPFWKSLGFKETGFRKPYHDGSVKSETIILEKQLA